MLKKVVMLIIVMLLGVFLYSPSFATPLSVGQTIYFQNGPGTTNGGEFDVYDWTTKEYIYKSFCLETDEYLSYGSKFLVSDISTEARSGGSGGPSPDPLDQRTAYLYHNFYHGTLEGYAYSGSTTQFANRDLSANALQKAIWYFEQETGGEQNFYTQLAQAAIDAGLWLGLGDVVVINLTDIYGNFKQDQLGIAPVPEPATMLLLGTGLIGLAGVGRRKLLKH